MEKSSNLSKSVKNKKNKSEVKKVEISKISQKFEFSKFRFFFAFGIFALSFLIYSNTINHEYVVDDIIVTTQNPLVQKGFEGIPDLISHGYFYANTGRNDESYRPMSMVMIAVETEIFGLSPKVSHFFNILFYSLSCLLLFLFLERLFSKYNYLIPLLITILYAVHPVHTEVVANVKSRDELMHFFFIISTLLLLILYIDKRKIYILIISIFSYFLALLSKENAITFIAVIPFMLFFFRDLKPKEVIIQTSPFIIVFVIYFILRMNILDTVTFENEITLYQNSLVGAENIFEYLATNFVIHLKYLTLLIFPANLSWDYSYNQIPIVNFTDFKAILSLLIFIALGVYSIIGIKKKVPIAFGILFYIITISIVSNFIVKIASTMGERFIFTSSLGFCISIIFLFEKILSKSAKKNIILIFSISAISLLMIIRTFTRNKDWKTDESIYKAGVEVCTNSSRAHIALADTYRLKISTEQNPVIKNILFQNSVTEFEKSIEIYPNNPSVYYSFGFLYYSNNLKEKALQLFTKGLKYDSLNLNLLNYSGIIETENGNYEKGKELFSKLIKIDTTFAHAYNNLGYIYTKLSDFDNALECYNKILIIDPDYESLFRNIGATYLNKKDYEKSLEFYRKALEKNPENIEIIDKINILEKILSEK